MLLWPHMCSVRGSVLLPRTPDRARSISVDWKTDCHWPAQDSFYGSSAGGARALSRFTTFRRPASIYLSSLIADRGSQVAA